MNHDETFMKKAIELAFKAREKGNEPFGAILVKDGQIVCEAENQVHTLCDPTSHAELGLIRKFCSENRIFNLQEYILYTSTEPCIMCSGSIVWSGVGKVIYSVTHDQLSEIAGGNIMIGCTEVFAKSPHQPEVTGSFLNEDGLKAFEGYSFGHS